MKPVYLEMTYFGPHEHSIIDFTKLEEAPIFLIGGDTGAGKSTIFDAMTYALFGTTTSNRDAKEMRSQFAPAQQKTEVVFYFEQGNQLYKIVRTPEQRLAKKTKAGGLTKRGAKASLSIVETVGGVETQSITSKVTEVNTEVGNLLHLSSDQFKKIILLPQNDFSEFLKSNTSDKEPILKRIFGTQIFTGFTEKLKTKYDDFKKQGASFETALKSQVEAMELTPEETTAYEQGGANQQILLGQFVETRKKKYTIAAKQVQVAAEKSQQAEAQLQSGQTLAKNLAQRETLKTNYQETIVANANDIAEKEIHIQALNWAHAYQETVTHLHQTQELQKERMEIEPELVKKVQASKTETATAQKAWQQFVDQKEAFVTQQKRVDLLTSLIPLLQRREKTTTALTALTPEITELAQKLATQQKEHQKTTTALSQKQEALAKYGDLQKQRAQQLSEKEAFVTQFSPLESQRTHLEETLAEQQVDLTALHTTQTKVQAQLQDIQKIYEQKIQTRQALMIAQLQQELTDGMPCPVCGAIDHPKVAHQAIPADEAQLKAAMDEVDNAQKAYATAENEVTTAKKNISTLQEKIVKTTAQLKQVQVALTTQYTNFVTSSTLKLPASFQMNDVKETFDEAVTKIDAELKVTQTLRQDIEALEVTQETIATRLTKIQLQQAERTSRQATYQQDLTELNQKIPTELTATSATLAQEQDQLKQAIEDYNTHLEATKEAVHQNNLMLSKNETQLEDLQTQIKTQATTLTALETTIQTALQAKTSKTNDRAMLDTWILELQRGVDDTLQQTVTSYHTKKEMLGDQIQQLDTLLKDATTPDLVQLQQGVETQKTFHTTAISEASQAKLIFEKSQDHYQQIQEILQNQNEFSKKLAEITSLYHIINGQEGNDRKLKLETYVVQSYLQKVLDYANTHFINLLSNNRYTFELLQESDNKQRDHGLDINVYDNETGAKRSSDTLSGGETFIAALSIALSLSEVVQSSANGVQIDALFIDEGFGSLDTETLGKAMAALETIGENRMVGVISHIDSMKATIGQQVLVQKIGDGRSTVKIVTK